MIIRSSRAYFNAVFSLTPSAVAASLIVRSRLPMGLPSPHILKRHIERAVRAWLNSDDARPSFAEPYGAVGMEGIPKMCQARAVMLDNTGGGSCGDKVTWHRRGPFVTCHRHRARPLSVCLGMSEPPPPQHTPPRVRPQAA